MNSYRSKIIERQDDIESSRRKMMKNYKLNRGQDSRHNKPSTQTYQFIHCIIKKNTVNIEDHLRITFTRFWLSSHRLRMQMGRWSRTPSEQRVCLSNAGIQDEKHVLLCPRTQVIHAKYGHNSTELNSLFVDTELQSQACLALLEDLQDSKE